MEEKATDSVTGSKHYHFWGSGKNSVEFTLEQTVEGLKTGTYQFEISIMGGDCGATEIYAYAKINGEIVARADTVVTVYNEWHTAALSGIQYNQGDTITVGLYVRCASAGAWGKIDDAKLNFVTE